MTTLTAHNATLDATVALLQEQRTRRVDVVAPATSVMARDGQIIVRGAEAQLTDDGVTQVDGTYTPTPVFHEGVADKLGIPVGYLKRLSEDRPDLYDSTINGFLHGRRAKVSLTGEVLRPGIDADTRSFLIRAFRGDETGTGIARAMLSNSFLPVDNLDVLLTTLTGIRDAGVDVSIDRCDVTDRRMVVRVKCPQVSALAPVLLAGYRSPFSGAAYGADNPTVFAGFTIANSEVGAGAFTITPTVTVEVCNNGMLMTRDAVRKTHLGSRMDDGQIRYAADTQEAALTLIQKQSRDAVSTFLSPEYLAAAVTALEVKAGTEVADHEEVRQIVKPLRYSDGQVDGILGYFTRGGQMTVGGVVNAITAYSQTVEDGDVAYDLDARATSLLV